MCLLSQEPGTGSASVLLAEMQLEQQLWEAAAMPDVVSYLRGCKSLNLPIILKEALGL